MALIVMRRRGGILVPQAIEEPRRPDVAPSPRNTADVVMAGDGTKSPAFMQLVDVLFDGHTNKVKALVRRLEDPAELRAVHGMEVKHPDHPGGRQPVLDAIDEQLSKLDMSHESPSLDL